MWLLVFLKVKTRRSEPLKEAEVTRARENGLGVVNGLLCSSVMGSKALSLLIVASIHLDLDLVLD